MKTLIRIGQTVFFGLHSARITENILSVIHLSEVTKKFRDIGKDCSQQVQVKMRVQGAVL